MMYSSDKQCLVWEGCRLDSKTYAHAFSRGRHLPNYPEPASDVVAVDDVRVYQGISTNNVITFKMHWPIGQLLFF